MLLFPVPPIFCVVLLKIQSMARSLSLSERAFVISRGVGQEKVLMFLCSLALLGLELGLGEAFADDGLGGGLLEVNGQVQGSEAVV